MPKRHRLLHMQRRTPGWSSKAKPSTTAKPAEPGRINQYTCQTCGGEIVTIDRHEGVTPAMLACRATPGCEGSMWSHRYQVDKTLTPGWEWYMPEKLPKGVMREHVQMGGLLLRRIENWN